MLLAEACDCGLSVEGVDFDLVHGGDNLRLRVEEFLDLSFIPISIGHDFQTSVRQVQDEMLVGVGEKGRE